MNFSKINFKECAAVLVCITLLFLLSYFAVQYLLPVVLPFFLAWGLALLLRPLNCYLERRFRIPRRLCAVLTVLLSLGLLFGILFAVLGRLAAELRSVALLLTAEPSPIVGAVASLFPPGEGAAYAEAIVLRLGEALLSALPPLLGSAVLTLPSVLLFLLVSVVASFYFSLDIERVHATVRSLLPVRIGASLGRLREGAFRLGLGYLRSYLILTGVILLIMLVGLSLLRVEYALLLSLVLAAVDILPVVGVGTVLIPWGAISLALGNTRLGIGLLLLFTVSEVARQVLEPRLLGSALGIHPLLSLFSLYLGARLFGLFGLVLGPLLAVLAKIVFGRIGDRKTKNPSDDGVSVGQARSTLPERRQREQT